LIAPLGDDAAACPLTEGLVELNDESFTSLPDVPVRRSPELLAFAALAPTLDEEENSPGCTSGSETAVGTTCADG
jgi:hypothetical protein